MFWQNLKTIHHACGELLWINLKLMIWWLIHAAVDHIATSSDDIEEVYHFEANIEDGENEGGEN
jgi:ferric iron reductase protein FhuF